MRERRPVVALETAVMTAGLPRDSFEGDRSWLPATWQADQPVNIEAARAIIRQVESAGATAATVAVLDGTLHIGLDEDALERLARDPEAGKTSTADLASVMESGGSAGTTVSATLAACGLARPRPIRVFATGGIGGVHRGWAERLDVSADLRAMTASPVCVVCAGAKSMLDVEATVEALEALGVPIVGYGTDLFPRFYSRGASAGPGVTRCDSPEAVARLCCRHWDDLRLGTSVMVAQPVAEAQAMDADEVERLVEQAEEAAQRAGRTGGRRTPFVLSELSRLTGGRSLEANLAVLLNNAALAGRVARVMAEEGA